MPGRPPGILGALGAALAALPGYAETTEPLSGYRFTLYTESDLPSARAASGERSARYHVETHQLTHRQSIAPRWEMSAGLMFESMSGASPWFVLPDADGRAVQVMSAASIREERTALSTRWTRDVGERIRIGVEAGGSDEDDYSALSLGASAQLESDDGMRTWSFGAGFSDDRLSPTDGGSETYPDRIRRADKFSSNAVVGLSQVLGRTAVAQFSLAIAHDDGYLSDPYKLVFVADDVRPDSRPSSRTRGALLINLRRHLRSLRTTLRADWRHFRDSWDVNSDTVELAAAWRTPAELWRVHGALRWYRQSAARFFRNSFDTPPASGLHSADYRLSPYGAVSLRVGVDYRRPRWAVALALEGYDTHTGYGLSEVATPSPGLVDFALVSLAVSWNFAAPGRVDAAAREPVRVLGP